MASRITVRHDRSSAYVRQFSRIDFLMIDGDHALGRTRFDFKNFSSHIVSGAFVAFHDHYPDRHDLGPTWVIHHLVKSGGRFREFSRADALWLAPKN